LKVERMKRRDVLAAGAVLAASAWTPFARAGRVLTADHRARIQALIGQMTLAEKVGQMNQIAGGRQKSLNSKLDAAMLDRVRKGEMGSFLHVAGAEPLRDLQRVAVEESRLKIPLLFAMDVIHGYRTILPVPLALAASWDPRVAEQAARIASEEAWAAGLHWTFTPMVDVARDPRWGRVVEGAGEDAYLGSRIAEAQVAGFQGADLAKGMRMMACAKHFVGYGAAAGGRDYDSADVSERALNEVYLPPFHAAARAGAGSFMTAFNDLGGVPMTANADLVRGFLRARWNYQGLVVSDWNAIRELVNHGIAADAREAAVLALKAGVDMDMASGSYATYLAEAATADASLMPLIDEAVGRILAAKARLGLFDDPYGFGDPVRDKAPLRRTEARDLARRSVVLLRNDGALLPLKAGAKLALIGALADDASSAIGSWRARGQAADAVTLKAALTGAEYLPGTDVAAAVEAAKRADVVLVAIGEDYDRTGEARSYAEIGLPGAQAALLEALKATGKPIVAILMGGRPLALERELTGVPAVLQTWLLGIESGPAIAEILTGKAAPGGRLPIGMPRKTGQSPQSYAHLPTGRPANPDLTVDSVRYHDTDIGPLFAFGHGLTYGEIAYGPLTLSAETLAPGGRITASVQVTNRGTMAVEEVVQLYANDPVASVSRPVAELRGFARVPLKPGQNRTVRFTLAPEQFAFWRDGKWIVEPGEIRLMAGASAADLRSEAKFRITVGGKGDVPAASLATKVEIA
jgi:beta-glucosidase